MLRPTLVSPPILKKALKYSDIPRTRNTVPKTISASTQRVVRGGGDGRGREALGLCANN